MVRFALCWVVAWLCMAGAMDAYFERGETDVDAFEYGPPVRVVRALSDDVRAPDECFRTRGGLDLCMWDDDSGAHVVVLDHATRI